MIVLDTNVLSELTRAEPAPSVVAWLDRWESSELYTTALTAAELRGGVEVLPPGRRRDLLAADVERLLTGTLAGSLLPFDGESARHYADVVSARRRAGAPIEAFDAQIAAICLQHGAVLATRNLRDFEGVGLPLVNPWAA